MNMEKAITTNLAIKRAVEETIKEHYLQITAMVLEDDRVGKGDIAEVMNIIKGIRIYGGEGIA